MSTKNRIVAVQKERRIRISFHLILDRRSALKIMWAPFQGDDTTRLANGKINLKMTFTSLPHCDEIEP